MGSIKGNAAVRPRPASAAVVIDLRGQPEPAAGRGRISMMGASSTSDLWTRSSHRLQPVADLVLAAWFGGPAISLGGESGVTRAGGRVCGGNSPTMSSDRPSLGWGS
jgi:hypothetical protein